MDDHMTLLHDHFLFQGAEELLHEAQSLGVSRFSRGDTICDPATAGRALGIVLEGRTEAVAPTREKAVLAVFGPGGTFGMDPLSNKTSTTFHYAQQAQPAPAPAPQEDFELQ